MSWLFLLLALAALAVAFMSSSMVLVVLGLLAALVLLCVWILGLLAQRVGDQSRDQSLMLDPGELRRLRELAEARRAAAAAPDESQAP